MRTYFIKVLPDESRVIALRTERGIQIPKSATHGGKRHILIKDRTPAEQRALVRTLNTPVIEPASATP